MTPKEKARELVDKMSSIIEGYGWEEISKECALIAVDEIIESHYKLLSGVKTSIYKYWQEVKQEIEKL
jgi:predicted Co/Zn/Cd cation transporter (cation efflux family)